MENGVVTVLHFLLHRKGVPKAIRLLGHPPTFVLEPKLCEKDIY